MEEISSQDIRWKQRFQNYEKAFKRLSRAIEVVKSAPEMICCNPGSFRPMSTHLNWHGKH